jgi:histidinol-phosphate phosphatase family protein
MNGGIQAAFIDRDGTLGGDASITYPEQFGLFDCAPLALNLLRSAGISLYAFTNQPGISTGVASEYDFRTELMGFGMDDAYICSHTQSDGCDCRKPKPGMLNRAAQEHGLDLSRCVVVGDRWSDMLAAANAGCRAVLVLTGAGRDALGIYRQKWAAMEPDFVAHDILEAANWIINQAGQTG